MHDFSAKDENTLLKQTLVFIAVNTVHKSLAARVKNELLRCFRYLPQVTYTFQKTIRKKVMLGMFGIRKVTTSVPQRMHRHRWKQVYGRMLRDGM